MRLDGEAIAPIALIEYQRMPCSPAFENVRMASSTGFWWPRVRSCRSSAVSSAWTRAEAV